MTRQIAAFALACILIGLYGCAGDGGGGSSGGGTVQVGPPAQLAVIQQPAGATTGNVFATQPRVEIQDAAGLRVSTDNTTQVSVTLSGGTGGALLSGTASLTAINGVVSFNGLGIDLAGTAYTLNFTATGLTGTASNAFNVTTASAGGGTAPFVPPAPSGTASYYVSPTGNDGNSGTTPAQAWATLQQAANTVQAGDIVEVADGNYARFTLSSVTGTSGMPIVFRASGNAAVINSGTSASTTPDNRDAIKIYDCHYVIIHGLRTLNAYRAGVRVTESFNITIQGGVFSNGGRWGIFTDYSDDVVLEGNECHDSGLEHGIYFSNSGDRPLIRGNYCHDNNASGIQINSDPAQQVAAFGTRGDGITEDGVIENNWCEGNGINGAAGLNFASIRDCDIRNNLVVNNLNQSGIALWDDGYSSAYGSMNNRIYHNTVVFQSGNGRFCLSMLNGSTGNDIRNNIFIGGARGAITWSSDSLSGTTADYNICRSTDGWGVWVNDDTSQAYTLAQWQALISGAPNSVTTAPTFNGANDFSLPSGSAGRDDGQSGLGLATAHDGASRPQGGGIDRGCYED
jgi:parallel beta-helix repeat protein